MPSIIFNFRPCHGKLTRAKKWEEERDCLIDDKRPKRFTDIQHQQLNIDVFPTSIDYDSDQSELTENMNC